jgi:tetratricopeptide (TPR) repeat protein
MHRHLDPHDWALAFGDPDDPKGWQLFSCPTCGVARGDLETWILSVAECQLCWQAFEAFQPVPRDAFDCDACLSGYEEFERWLERAEHFEPLVAPEWDTAAQHVTELVESPVDTWLPLVESNPALHRWGFCQRLLEECKALWLTDPLRAHALALVAVAVAERIEGRVYHPRWVADLRAKAHAYVANTYRIQGDFHASEGAFARAEWFVEKGTGQGRAEIRVLSLKASLLLDQHRHLESEAILSRVEQHLREFGQIEELAKVLLKRARVADARDQPKQAILRTQEALELIDADSNPQLHELAHSNLTQFQLDSGDVAAARAAYETLPEPRGRRSRILRELLGAHVLRAEGDLDGAARIYDDVRIAFLAEDFHFDVALVSLDLAIVARMQGDHETVRELARDALVLLTRAGAPQAAFAAIRLLVDAVEHEAVSTAFIQQVTRNLSRVRVPK